MKGLDKLEPSDLKMLLETNSHGRGPKGFPKEGKVTALLYHVFFVGLVWKLADHMNVNPPLIGIAFIFPSSSQPKKPEAEKHQENRIFTV